MAPGEEAAAEFHVAVEPLAGGVLSVAVAGDIDLDTASLLVREVTAALAARPSGVRLDLEAVTFMDSTGTMALLQLRDAVEAYGCQLTLVRPSRSVTLLFELSGLVDQFEIDRAGPT